MSVLINMEMPKSCDDCPLQHSEYLECKITGNNTWEWADDHTTRTIHPKPSDCPLVPVPPHGRLIDADALDADLERQDMHTGEWDAVGFSIEEIENAPTVIEAEEGE